MTNIFNNVVSNLIKNVSHIHLIPFSGSALIVYFFDVKIDDQGRRNTSTLSINTPPAIWQGRGTLGLL